MKKVLGLDLGSSSVGWAIAQFNDGESKIVDMGSRIVPLTPDDQTQFSKGQAITKNAERTTKRTIRKGYNREQMRRDNLIKELSSVGITPATITKPIDLWGLRSKAVTEKISPNELGRVLFHLNHKRGYRSGKEDYNDSTKSSYVKAVNENYNYLKNNNLTIGQYFYSELLEDGSFRIKDRVYPRIAYVEEYDRIMSRQRDFYPDLLTEEFIKKLRDNTIFYQRRLKSCKHLVSVCEFEKKEYRKKDGTKVCSGPHVAPQSSPIAQLCRIWEFVNTIPLKSGTGEDIEISLEQKRLIAEYLQSNEKLKQTDFLKIIGKGKKECRVEKTTFLRNVGNNTLIELSKALQGKRDDLLQFHIRESEWIDNTTGEIRPILTEDIKREPLYQLWHTLYSISDEAELRGALEKKFGIKDEEILSDLCKIDYVKAGYAGKSATAIRKILPFLMRGKVYSEACALAGYNHSGYVTKSQEAGRELSDHLENIKKGELRQPIVEKILNQTINVVNALNDRYGPFDEIRVELARELKQSREEREKTTKNISKKEKENKALAEQIRELGLTPTKNRILKMKLWEETAHRCIYCNQPVNLTEFLSGIDVEKEHIVPRSLLFDNSISNVTCSCRKCNQEKGNMTAWDYMKSKGEASFYDYVKRVYDLTDNKKINRTKRDRLLMSGDKIPSDFINRQLRETQYISKKSIELLKAICHNVYATNGSVTDFLRHVWGWDNVLHDLHFNQYKAVGLTETREIPGNGSTKTEERIKDWSKRLDHRHHAIDALTIACTSQSIIQQLNTLNTLKDVPFKSYENQGDAFKERHTKLERYVLSQPHFTTNEVKAATEKIIVSFKSGKKVATPGKRYTYSGGKRVLRQNVLVPRGALSEETVYGRISDNGEDKIVAKYPITSIDLKKAEKIVDKKIRSIVIEYLNSHGGKILADSPVLDHQGKKINSVRLFTGLDAVVPVKFDDSGKAIGFVKPGNNHHIAIYKDNNGKYRENAVTFQHAVERKKYGLPVVIEDPAATFDKLGADLPESFVAQLPDPSWKFVISLQQNEMFVLGMSEEDFRSAINKGDTASLSAKMYRVQKISSGDYHFRHHLETSVDDKIGGVKDEALSMKLEKLKRVRSLDKLFEMNPHKVRVDNLGKISND